MQSEQQVVRVVALEINKPQVSVGHQVHLQMLVQ
jgi:hypothetical protein